MTRLCALLFAVSSALGAEIPAGSMPVIDGVWGEKEWVNAHPVQLDGGEARLRTSGRALCLAVRIDRPYAGERIDFIVATRSGARFCSHALHPAVHAPRLPFLPAPPILKQHGAWSKRAKLEFSDPYSARFRSRVLQKGEKSWTAEFAVAQEALNLPAGEEWVYYLRVVRAFGAKDRPIEAAPATWKPLRPKFDAKADLYETPKEDARIRNDLRLSEKGPTLAILEKKFAPDRVRELIEGCGKDQFFELWNRVHLLRRSNQLGEARGALREFLERMPAAATLKPVANERRQLLVLMNDYAALRESESGKWIDTVEAAWSQEKALRAQDGELARIVIETTAGAVVVELYTRDAAALTKTVLDWIGAGKCKELNSAWATGGIGFAFPGPTPPKDAKPSGRRAWRGTLAFVHEQEEGKLRLLLTTGHVHLYRSASAIGRIVEGQEVVDRLGASDRIVSARAP